MKRNFKLLVAVVVLAAMVLTLASCDVINGLIDKINPKPHEHTYSSDWSVDETNHWHAATCTDGEDCAAAKSDVAPHTYADGKCSVCGATDPNYTPACTEHTYGAPVETKAPTCTEKGEKTLTCTVCGETMTQEVAPNGHTEEKLEGKAPTCTEAGLSNGKKCSVCEEILVAQEEIPATNHTYVEGSCACGADDPNYNGPKTYVLDIQSMDLVSQKSKADGETAVFRNFFTIYYSQKFKLDESNKTFEDGFKATQRLNWGGGSEVNKEIMDEDDQPTGKYMTKNVIEFNVTGTATVKVWWVHGGYIDNDVGAESGLRQLGIYDEEGNIVTQTNVEGAKNDLFISELTISKPGKYYLGNVGNTNYFFKVEVVVTPIVKETINVATTDTYNYELDKIEFTATSEGEYTFYLPAGLGAADEDNLLVDFYNNADGAEFTVGLEANETYVIYVAATEKKDWQVQWSFFACDVEDEVAPTVEATPLTIGNNNINAADVTWEYTAPSAANLTLTAGGAIMGPVAISYAVNGGEATTLELNATVTLALAEGDKVVITVTATGYSTLTAAWSGETAGSDDDTDLDIGGTYTGTDSYGNALLTVTVDSEAGTVEFVYNHPMMGPSTLEVDYAIVDGAVVLYAEDGSVLNPLAGSLTLTDDALTGASYNGTDYTLAVSTAGGEGDDDDDGEEGGETDTSGTEDNPYVWETLPESATAEGDSFNKIFYTFTATANGTLTVTYPTANSWWTLTDKTDASLSTQGYSLAVNTAELVAGHEYVLGLGAWDPEESDPTVTISFTEGTTGDGEEDTECDHNYEKVVGWHPEMVAATCTTGGVDVYMCTECDDTYTESSEPNPDNHDYVTNMETYKAATCKEDGYREATCSYCNDHKEYILDSETYGSHNWVTEESTFVEPTCQTDGYCKKVCSLCSAEDVIEEEASDYYHKIQYSSYYSVEACSVCGKTTFSFNVNATETTYGVGFSTNYMGVGLISVWNTDYSVNEAFAYTATLADGVYTLTLSNVYENDDTYGLMNSTVTVTPACTGILVTITPAEGDALTFKNYEVDHIDSNGDFLCDAGCNTIVEPEADSTLTLAQAAALGALYEKSVYSTNKYWVEGVIDSIDSNGSMTLKDDDGNTFYVYKSNGPTGTWYSSLSIKHVKGDTVKVYGAIGKYDYPQIQYGATTVVAHTHAYADATCTEPKTCACGATDGEANGHSYGEDGKCSCGASAPVAGETTVTLVAPTLDDSTNMNNTDNFAATLGLDETLFSVTEKNCGNNTHAGLNKSGEIRMYAASTSNGAAEGDGTEITVTINGDKKIKSITITFSSDTYAKGCQISAGENVVTTADGSSATVIVTIDANSFTLKNTSTAQVRFKSIQITYA